MCTHTHIYFLYTNMVAQPIAKWSRSPTGHSWKPLAIIISYRYGKVEPVHLQVSSAFALITNLPSTQQAGQT